MAKGRFQINSTLDTATDPDDTELLAAPGATEAIYVEWLAIIVTTLEAATTINIEDGAGGSVLLSHPSTALGTSVYRYKVDGSEGLKLSLGTALNATTAGGTALAGRVVGEVVVR